MLHSYLRNIYPPSPQPGLQEQERIWDSIQGRSPKAWESTVPNARVHKGSQTHGLGEGEAA